jgi:hypothetical protein
MTKNAFHYSPAVDEGFSSLAPDNDPWTYPATEGFTTPPDEPRGLSLQSAWEGDWIKEAQRRHVRRFEDPNEWPRVSPDAPVVQEQYTKHMPTIENFALPSEVTALPPGSKNKLLDMRIFDPKSQEVAPIRDAITDPERFRHRFKVTPVSDEEYEQYIQEELDILPESKREMIPFRQNILDESRLSPTDYTERSSKKGVANIEYVLSTLTPEELEYWRKWYRYAHDTAVQLARKYNKDLMTVAGVIAIMSPQTDWVENIRRADIVLSGQFDRVYHLDTSMQRAYALIMKGDFSAILGPKVFPFFLSIFDPVRYQDEVVVDKHAIGIWLGRPLDKSIPDLLRDQVTRDYGIAGAKFGLTAQEAQAAAWAAWRASQMFLRRAFLVRARFPTTFKDWEHPEPTDEPGEPTSWATDWANSYPDGMHMGMRAQRQPWVAVDLDGTILSYESGWGEEGKFGDPLPGAIEALNELMQLGWRVSIYTARFSGLDETSTAELEAALSDYLTSVGVPFSDIWIGHKPQADAFVDDRALRFEGDWSTILQQLAVNPAGKRAWALPDTQDGGLTEEWSDLVPSVRTDRSIQR